MNRGYLHRVYARQCDAEHRTAYVLMGIHARFQAVMKTVVSWLLAPLVCTCVCMGAMVLGTVFPGSKASLLLQGLT
jgi:hypothetical protein